VRVSGSVVGSGTVLHDATLAIGGDEAVKRTIPCTLELRTEAGSSVTVEVLKVTVLGPRKELDGTWGDVSADRLATPFGPDAPGHDVRVKLSGVAIAAGDEITVDGWAVDGAHVKAVLIGIGAEGVQWVRARADGERPPSPAASAPQPTSASPPSVADGGTASRPEADQQAARQRAEGSELTVWQAIPIGLLGLAAIAHGQSLPPAMDGSQLFAVRGSHVFGLFLVTLALFVWRRRRFLLRMLEAQPGISGDVLWRVHPWATWVVGVGLPVSLVLAATTTERDGGIGVAGYIGALLASVTLWGVIVVETRADARALRRIAATRPVHGGEDWGRRQGTLVRGELTRRRTHDRTTTTTTGWATVTDAVTGESHRVETSNTSTWYKAREHGGSGKLKVQVDDRMVDLDIFGRARWGTTRRCVDGLTLTESMLPGDEVLVVGRIDSGGMRATATESLFVLGSHRGDVRGVLVRELWMHYAAMLGFASVIGAEIYFLFTH
jgi:hypothetical protein